MYLLCFICYICLTLSQHVFFIFFPFVLYVFQKNMFGPPETGTALNSQAEGANFQEILDHTASCREVTLASCLGLERQL